MEPISTALRELMTDRGMSVEDVWLAAGLGGPSGVYRYLKGDRGRLVNSQSAPVIEKIARALGVAPDYFLEYRAYTVREVARRYPDLADSVYDLLIEAARLRGFGVESKDRDAL